MTKKPPSPNIYKAEKTEDRVSLASPKSILVFSPKNNGLSTLNYTIVSEEKLMDNVKKITDELFLVE